MDPEFIEPTHSSRRNIVVVWVTALIAGVAIIEARETMLAVLMTRPICEVIVITRAAFAVVLGLLAIAALWLAWIARRGLRLNQWPLPGTWVWRRTPIYRGRAMRWRAYALLSASIAMLVICAVEWHLVGEFFSRAKSRSCAEQVTVLLSNNGERTLEHRRPRLSSAWWLWPAAQLGR